MIRLFLPQYFPDFLGLEQRVHGPLALMWMRLGKQLSPSHSQLFWTNCSLWCPSAIPNRRRAEEVGNGSRRERETCHDVQRT